MHRFSRRLRRIAALAALLSSSLLGTAPAHAGAPERPGTLRVAIYSATAAELFWSRSNDEDGLVLGYELRVNGELVGTLDALSWFSDELTRGRTYEVTLVAIDDDGERSTPATLSFVGGERRAPPSADGPAVPTGLRHAVYSSRSAELFWDRPAAFGLRYEIARDGVILRTIDGLSHYENRLERGRVYAYAVTAIDAEGRRSAPATLTLSTGDPTPPDGPVTPPSEDPAIVEPPAHYTSDGYETVDVVRLDVRTETTPGTCTPEDQSGCTLADVIADIDGSDDFTVDIPVHFRGEDYPDDGSVTNAGLRQRGGYTRLAPQKSFRVKLDKGVPLWRDERRLQLNKMPYDSTRIRNKLAFDLMRDIPSLPSLRTQFVNLWIDDGAGPIDRGLFTHTEYVGKEYLANRGWDTDGNLYKAEKFLFALADLEYMALDEDGEPLDEDRFEERLEIKRGDDHRQLVEMVRALNDPANAFESVLERHFDAENVLTWATVKLLLHQTDGITHNFYLYNPAGSEKFYFLPWDFDGAFDVERTPVDDFATDALLHRLAYGYGKGRASNFLARYYRLPGIHRKVLAKADEIRREHLTDAEIAELASRYAAVIAPWAGRLPDREHNRYDTTKADRLAGYVAAMHDALRGYGIPLPPRLNEPRVDEGEILFRWRSAHDMREIGITYDLEISSSPAFEPDARLVLLEGLDEEAWLGTTVERDRVGSGTRYARLIARAAADPATLWQIASNRPVIDGEMRVGVRAFEVP